MERFTHESDGYYAVSDDVCYEDQNEEYSGPAIERLAAYEDTMLTPRQIKDADDFLKENYQLRLDSLIHAYDLLKAEQEGRLLVLPCITDAVLVRDGIEYSADHWNHSLTAFANDSATRSGKRVALFSIPEAEAALRRTPDGKE